MAFKLHSFIEETFTTTGTGAITLGGASNSRRKTFGSELSNGDTCFYAAEGGSDYEEGLGTYSGGELTRTAVFKSSNSNNAVDWPAGTKTIRIVPLGLSDLSAAGLNLYKDLLNVGLIGFQVFTGNGTYTPTAGMRYCIVEACGGGGGGGGAAQTSAGTINGAGGGGGGEYVRSRLTADQIGASKAVVIGALGGGGSAGNNAGSAGGDTTLGTTIVVAKGGSPGGGAAAGANRGTSGAGGTGGTGDFKVPGASGFVGQAASITTVLLWAGGAGGRSVFGNGGLPRDIANNGYSASGYGGGGGGGADANNGANRSGGNGTAGIMIITEFG